MAKDQLVDPAVSRSKFDREVASFAERRWEYHKRGWLLVEAEFPRVFVVFAKPELHPKAVLFGADLDFTNYDLWAPSVTLVDPFTREPYTTRQLPPNLAFVRLREEEGQAPTVENFLQSHGPDERPFLCMPGVREYHGHPAHTNDVWFEHRNNGEGTLYFLLEKTVRVWRLNLCAAFKSIFR